MTTVRVKRIKGYVCPICCSLFDTLPSMTLYKCPSCGYIFAKEDTENNSRTCPDCGKLGEVYTSQGCPECHSEYVIPEIFYECPLCGAKALQRDDIIEHMKIHRKEGKNDRK